MKNFTKEVQDYLEKVSRHTYQSGDRYMKLIIGDDVYKVIEWSKRLDKYVIREINVAQNIKWYGENAKCVTSHDSFLNKPSMYGDKYSGIRQTKYVKSEIADIMKELDL